MKKTKSIIKWNSSQLDRFESFIRANSQSFLDHFYRNLLNPVQKIRREPRIFIRMHQFVGKTTKQCKSKFQKCESRIFRDILRVPADHFDAFRRLQRAKGARHAARRCPSTGAPIPGGNS